jgi:hypothetical protein
MAQDSTVACSQVLIGGRQTDREGTYVTVGRAPERTGGGVAREREEREVDRRNRIERAAERDRTSIVESTSTDGPRLGPAAEHTSTPPGRHHQLTSKAAFLEGCRSG